MSVAIATMYHSQLIERTNQNAEHLHVHVWGTFFLRSIVKKSGELMLSHHNLWPCSFLICAFTLGVKCSCFTLVLFPFKRNNYSMVSSLHMYLSLVCKVSENVTYTQQLCATPLPCMPCPQKFTEKTFVGLHKSAESFPLYGIHINMYPLHLFQQCNQQTIYIEQKKTVAIMDKSPLPTNNTTAEFGYVCTFSLAQWW